MALNKTYFESKGRDVTNPIPESPSYVPPVVPTPPDPDPGSVPDIPRPTLTGNVSCSLYENSCDKNMINKDLYLSTILDTTVSIKEETSIVNPEIYIKTSANIKNSNYMKLGNNYYYISITLIPGDSTNGALYRINGVRDALTTFKNDILMLDCIIDKQQYENNMYINDGSYIVEERETVQVVNFTGGFEDSGKFILIAAGG